jgi:hypothetical protein
MSGFARVERQWHLLPAGRSGAAPTDADLPHRRSPFLSGLRCAGDAQADITGGWTALKRLDCLEAAALGGPGPGQAGRPQFPHHGLAMRGYTDGASLRGCLSGFIWVQPAHRDQAEPEVTYLCQHPVQRWLIGQRPGNDRLLAVGRDLEALEPGRPALVKGPGLRRARKIRRTVASLTWWPSRDSSPCTLRYPKAGFSRASRSTRSRISWLILGRPGWFEYVHLRVIRRRCQASSVPGVTSRWGRNSAVSSRASVASIARSAQSGFGRATCRRSTVTSCRCIMISASLDA